MFVIRPFNKDSATDLAEFRRITLQWVTPELTEELDLMMINDPYGVIVEQYHGHLFVGEEINGVESTVVGFSGLTFDSEGVYELVKVGVDASVQGKGIGRKMITHCIEKARELKATKVTLESHSSLKAARRLYDSLGFVFVHGKTHFVTADVKMELIL